MIYLWEGFWNGFLLGQTCEVPATARGNNFKTFVCLDNLDMFICCTGIGLLAQEQKMAVDLIVPEMFIFGKGSGILSCLAKRVRYQLLQGETILEHWYA